MEETATSSSKRRTRQSETAFDADDAQPKRRRLNGKEEDLNGDEVMEVDLESDSQDDDEDSEPLENESKEDAKSRQQNSADKLGAGTITKIICKDFIIHPHLSLDLGPNINFIHGSNGSGKSTILAAIQICLGGKAQDTGRGQLKKLIREGQNRAVVSVTLKNEGANPWRLDQFGSRIIVERELRRTGATSTYRIKNGETKKLLSTKREDVQDLCTHFSINISNPVIVMTQDKVRSFLSDVPGKAAKRRYELFQEATQLSDIAESLDQLHQKLELAKDEIKASVEVRLQDKAKEHNLKAAVKDASSIEDLLGKKQKLNWLLAWALIREEAQTVQKTEKKLFEMKEELQKTEKKILKYTQFEVTSIEDRKAEEEAGKERNLKMDQTAEFVTQAYKELKKVLKDQSKYTHPIKRWKATMIKIQAKIKKTEKKLASVSTKTRPIIDREAIERERQNRLEALHKKVSVCEQGIDQYKANEASLESEVEAFQGSLHTAVRLRDRLKKARASIGRQLDTLTQSRGDANLLFGQYTSKILSGIETRASKFGVRPMGPLGRHISVASGSERWGMAIETILTDRTMKAYLVDSYRDAEELRSIFKKALGRNTRHPDVIVFKKRDESYDLKSDPSVEHLPTIHSMLQFENAWVECCFIDQQSTERWYCCNSEEKARALIRQSTQFVKGILNEKGDRLTKKGNTIALRPHRGQRHTLLKPDVEADILEFKVQYREKTDELKTAETNCAKLKAQERKFQQSLRELRKQIKSGETETDKLLKKIHEVEAEELEEEEDAEEEDAGEALREEIKLYQTEIQELEGQVKDAEEKAATYNEPRAAAEDLLDKARDELKRVTAVNAAAAGNLDKLIHYCAKIKRGKAKYVMERDLKEREVSNLQSIVDQRKEKMDRMQEQADSIRPEQSMLRPNSTKTRQQLQKTLKKIEAHMLGWKSRNKDVDIEALNREYNQIKKRVEEQQIAIQSQEQAYQKLKILFEQRKHDWSRIRDVLARKSGQQFAHALKQQNHEGSLKFDHEKKELHMNVTPHKQIIAQSQMDQGSGDSVIDTKSLSGGEKSYATLSFTLALGERVEAPFRAMDEFDVFMDPVNRNMSIAALIATAKRHPHRQYLFITPHDISMLNVNDQHVKVFKLEKPDRAQGRLNFGGRP